MSVKAAKDFANVAQAVRKKQAEIAGTYYKRFIAGDEPVTAIVVAKFKKFMDETQAMANAWHSIVPTATQGFGGPQDMTLGNDHIMYKTMKKKAKEAQGS